MNSDLQLLQEICDIIARFMELDEEHCYVYNQDYLIPKDESCCVTVGLVNNKTYMNETIYDTLNGAYKEQHDVRQQTSLQINIFSYDYSAIERKEEILMALNSIYSVEEQQRKGFLIARGENNFHNISEKDGSKILYRFVINLNVLSRRQKVNKEDVNYYNEVNTSIDF